MNISPHFTLEELTVTSTGYDNTPTPELIENLKVLASTLERVRTALGAPITINSAYRSPKVNNAIRGSKTSDHVKGLAADFTVKGLTPKQICEKIIALGIPFQQMICEDISDKFPDGKWVHLAVTTGIPKNEFLFMKGGRYYK